MVSLNSYMAYDPGDYHHFGMSHWVQNVEEFDYERVIHFSIFDRWKSWKGVGMNDEAFWVTCWDNLEYQFYYIGFDDEYRNFFGKAFFAGLIPEYSSISSSVAVFGAICINVVVVRVFF